VLRVCPFDLKQTANQQNGASQPNSHSILQRKFRGVRRAAEKIQKNGAAEIAAFQWIAQHF
jgi:hypothetical protein